MRINTNNNIYNLKQLKTSETIAIAYKITLSQLKYLLNYIILLLYQNYPLKTHPKYKKI
jgi:hypothetical protein